jgi:hypothetical protein
MGFRQVSRALVDFGSPSGLGVGLGFPITDFRGEWVSGPDPCMLHPP